ncbi:unnamed protein product, partial [Hapterophycus canaliculatus]
LLHARVSRDLLPSYFIEYFATDLLMTPDGECVGVIAVCME